MHDWRNKGLTSHLLINKVMQYPKAYLTSYFNNYEVEYNKRYGKWLNKYSNEFTDFCDTNELCFTPYVDWLETKEHFRIEMANLYEKHLGVGKSKIDNCDWQKLLNRYYLVTGEEYIL